MVIDATGLDVLPESFADTPEKACAEFHRLDVLAFENGLAQAIEAIKSKWNRGLITRGIHNAVASTERIFNTMVFFEEMPKIPPQAFADITGIDHAPQAQGRGRRHDQDRQRRQGHRAQLERQPQARCRPVGAGPLGPGASVRPCPPRNGERVGVRGARMYRAFEYPLP